MAQIWLLNISRVLCNARASDPTIRAFSDKQSEPVALSSDALQFFNKSDYITVQMSDLEKEAFPLLNHQRLNARTSLITVILQSISAVAFISWQITNYRQWCWTVIASG